MVSTEKIHTKKKSKERKRIGEKGEKLELVSCLVFYSISTSLGYLTLNPIYVYIYMYDIFK